MGGYGALVLDTIGTAAAPILLLIGEENKHHNIPDVHVPRVSAGPDISGIDTTRFVACVNCMGFGFGGCGWCLGVC